MSKHPLFLYYYQPRAGEVFDDADRNAALAARTDKFGLVLCVGREPNSSDSIENRVGHFYIGMRKQKDGKKITTMVWRCPRKLVGALCSLKDDFENLVLLTGKSPVINTDIYPKCIRHSVTGKSKLRVYDALEMKRHFETLLSYKDIWTRIRLVIFSMEKSIGDEIQKRHDIPRLTFEKMVRSRYPKVEFLNVPFFGIGPRRFHGLSYWGDQMEVLAKGIKKFHPFQKAIFDDVYKDFCENTSSSIPRIYRNSTK